MKKSITNIFSVVLAMVMTFSLAGCGKEEVVVDTLGDELQQSDYRGGVLRTAVLQNHVLKVMEDMKVNNVIIREDSPNTFWTAEGYQDFVSTFLDETLMEDTQWFNEEELSWTDTLSQMAATPSSFSAEGSLKATITRNEKDDYTVSGVPALLKVMINGISEEYSKKVDFRVLYNCNKDWCKAYAVMNLSNKIPRITSNLFEYQRITDDIFAVQTSKERLIIVLNPVESDTDMRERSVKEFYYSRLVLDGERTTYAPYKPYEEFYIDEKGKEKSINENVKKNTAYIEEFPFVNENGDISSRYGINDSMFLLPAEDVSPAWVFEDKALQQGIVYKDGILIVTTYNKLSTDYERFIYTRTDADTTNLQALEDMVVIKDLVGVQDVSVSYAAVPDLEDETITDDEEQAAPQLEVTDSETETIELTDSAVTDENTDITENK